MLCASGNSVKCPPTGKFLMVFYLVHPDLSMNCFNQEKKWFQIQEDLSWNDDWRSLGRDWACLCSTIERLHSKALCREGGRRQPYTDPSHRWRPSGVYCAWPFTNLVSFALQQLYKQATHEFISPVQPLFLAPDPHLQCRQMRIHAQY